MVIAVGKTESMTGCKISHFVYKLILSIGFHFNQMFIDLNINCSRQLLAFSFQFKLIIRIFKRFQTGVFKHKLKWRLTCKLLVVANDTLCRLSNHTALKNQYKHQNTQWQNSIATILTG